MQPRLAEKIRLKLEYCAVSPTCQRFFFSFFLPNIMQVPIPAGLFDRLNYSTFKYGIHLSPDIACLQCFYHQSKCTSLHVKGPWHATCGSSCLGPLCVGVHFLYFYKSSLLLCASHLCTKPLSFKHVYRLHVYCRAWPIMAELQCHKYKYSQMHTRGCSSF